MSKWLLIPIDDDNGNGNGGGGGGGGSFGPLGLCLLPFIICDLFGYRALDDLSLERPLLLASNIPSMVLVVALFVFALLCCFDILKEYRGILTAVIFLIFFGLILFTALNLYLFGINAAYNLSVLDVIGFIGIPVIASIVAPFLFLNFLDEFEFLESSLRHIIFLFVTLALFPIVGFVQFYFLNGLGLLNIVPTHDSTLVEIQYANLEKKITAKAVRLNRKSVTQTDEEIEAMIKREWKRFQAKNSVPWFVGKTLKNNRRETIKFSKGKAFYLTYYNEEDDLVRLDGKYKVNVRKKTITCEYKTVTSPRDGYKGTYGKTVFSYNDILLYMDDESDAYDTLEGPFISDSAEFDAEEAKFLFGKKFEVDGKSLEFSKEGKVLFNGEETFSYIVDAPLETIVAFYEGNDIGFISQYIVDKKGNVTVTWKNSMLWFVGKTLKNQYETITLFPDRRVVATYNSGEIKVEGKYTVDVKNKKLTCKYKTITNPKYGSDDTDDTDVFSYSDILLYMDDEDYAYSDVLEGPFISDSAEFDAENAKFLFGKKFEIDDGKFVEFSKEGKVLLNGEAAFYYIVDEPIKTIVFFERTKEEVFGSFIGKYNVDTEGNVTVTIDGHEITSQ